MKFKITVENDGNIDLTDVEIIDTLPPCLEYIDGSATPVEPSISGNKLSWTYSSLAVGQIKVITFDATAIEEGENINDVNVTGKIPTGGEVTDDDTATVNVGAKPIPKIDCEGTLRWSSITTGSTVTGIIYVENIGDIGSELKWSVCGYPTWGTWTFTPSSGTGLKPAGGKKLITVTVVAPNQKRQQFTGQVTLCNDENTSDTCTIQVSLATPKNKQHMPLGIILAFGFDVDIEIVPGEDYVDLEVLNRPFYIWENELDTINPGAFIRLYGAKGLFLPSLPFCFGTCQDWSMIG